MTFFFSCPSCCSSSFFFLFFFFFSSVFYRFSIYFSYFFLLFVCLIAVGTVDINSCDCRIWSILYILINVIYIFETIREWGMEVAQEAYLSFTDHTGTFDRAWHNEIITVWDSWKRSTVDQKHVPGNYSSNVSFGGNQHINIIICTKVNNPG